MVEYFGNLSSMLKSERNEYHNPFFRSSRRRLGFGLGSVAVRLLRLLGLDAALRRVGLLPLLDHVRDVVGRAVRVCNKQ